MPVTSLDAASKLLRDTVYGIEKDVMKVLLLAIGSMIYGKLKDGNVIGRLLSEVIRRGPIVVAVAAVLAIVSVATAGPQRQEEGEAPSLARANAIGTGLAVLALFATMDQLQMNRWLAQQVRQFMSMVMPDLLKKLTLSRPPAQQPARADWARAVPFLLPSALLAQLLRQLERARAARVLAQARAMLESQAHPLVLQWRRLVRTRAQWQPHAEQLLQAAASILGTSSAVKYLLARAPRR